MKYALTLLAILSISFTFGQIKFDAVYLGQNLYLKNPYAENDGFRNCTDSVYVNGKKYVGNFNLQAFEINLTSLGIEIKDSIKVIIYHPEKCRPKVLNPTAFWIPRTFADNINLAEDGMLTWEYTGTRKQHFSIESYKWNGWFKIGSINGEKDDQNKKYSYQCQFHSGKNLIRIVKIDSVELIIYPGPTIAANEESRSPRDYPHTSIAESIETDRDEVKVKYIRKTKQFKFSSPTVCGLADSNRRLIYLKTENVSHLSISELKKGKYFLFYDNQIKAFKVRK